VVGASIINRARNRFGSPIMPGFAALLWLRGEVLHPHLRDSLQRNADRGKEPDKPSSKRIS